jgi:hypothetical protein
MKYSEYGKLLACLTLLCGATVLAAAPTASFPEGCYFSSSKSEEEAVKNPDAILFWLQVTKSGNTYQGKINNILTKEFIPNLLPQRDLQAIERQINSLVTKNYIDAASHIAVDAVVSDRSMEAQGQSTAFLMFAQEIQSGSELKKIFREDHFRFLLLQYTTIPIPFYIAQCR